MQDVSTFIKQLSGAAGGSANMRKLIAAAAGVDEISGPTVSMWKRRGIPWPLHDPMRRVCAQLGLPADPQVWRNVEREAA